MEKIVALHSIGAIGKWFGVMGLEMNGMLNIGFENMKYVSK